MKNGFTLAEVLVTLSIVGVIASITLPILNNNVQKQTYETGAKKAYNILSSAVGTYMADLGTGDLTETPLYNDTDGLNDFVNKYFRVVKDCGKNYTSNGGASCFSKELYSLNNSKVTDNSQRDCVKIITVADGMAFCFDNRRQKIVQKVVYDSFGMPKITFDRVGNSDVTKAFPLAVEVDINGLKGPNMGGRDVFYMLVNSNGQVVSPTANCNIATQSGRDKCVAYFTEHASPMPIGLLQYYGWKMKY